MGIVEENIKKILEDIKNSRFENEISKPELIRIINKYTQSAYGYFNRLWVDGYLEILHDKIFKIINLEFKEEEILHTQQKNNILQEEEEVVVGI